MFVVYWERLICSHCLLLSENLNLIMFQYQLLLLISLDLFSRKDRGNTGGVENYSKGDINYLNDSENAETELICLEFLQNHSTESD